MDWKNDVCVEASATDKKDKKILLLKCQLDNPHQQWTFRNYTTAYDDLIEGRTHTEPGTWQHDMLRLYHESLNQTLTSNQTTGSGVMVS